MLYNVYDIMVGRMLEVCGTWLSQEDTLHAILLNSGEGSGRILEAGAHIGARTIPLAMRVPQGRLLALEPSRLNLQPCSKPVGELYTLSASSFCPYEP